MDTIETMNLFKFNSACQTGASIVIVLAGRHGFECIFISLNYTNCCECTNPPIRRPIKIQHFYDRSNYSKPALNLRARP